MDWGRYDNDGPDGVPNSGDDDGFVDLLVVFQPTPGAECNGNYQRIWSHKWTISSWVGSPYATSTPAAGGGVIRVDDYTIQPVFDCAGQKLNEIGVFAHELGHGFGLPDLYCTARSCSHNGIGEWGLMGGGAWGCRGDNPARPCHMSAWSKSVLGWLDVETLPPGQDLGVRALAPVESSGKAFRVDAQDGSGEYFLLEHREPLGSDLGLYAPGLLVWHIDPQWIDQRWAANVVNNDATHLGVWLRQADGRNDIETSDFNRGDSGDPFPGITNATAFHAGSDPASLTHDGGASGLTLLDISWSPAQVSFHALTRFQTLTFRTEGETTGGLLAVDGAGLPGMAATVESAPFETHQVTAAPGEPLGPGRRRAFVEWTDDPELTRERTVTTGLEDAEYVARYGPLQVQLEVDVDGGQFGVSPGSVSIDPTSSDSWYAQGTLVSLQADATPGFAFTGWTGDLAGEPNPTMRALDGPVQAVAAFQLTYSLPEEVSLPLEAAAYPEVELTPPEGTAPFTWQVISGAFPDGLSLTTEGRLLGAPMAEGDFPVGILVTDALGLQAEGSVLVQVTAPDLDLSALGAQLLGTRISLTGLQLQFLDRVGNDDGSYDVGDLRIFLRSHDVQKSAAAPAHGAFAIPWVAPASGGGR